VFFFSSRRRHTSSTRGLEFRRVLFRSAFPSPKHQWGVQNLYVETLADLGLIGAAALVALFASAFVLGLRAGASMLPLVGVAWLQIGRASCRERVERSGVAVSGPRTSPR